MASERASCGPSTAERGLDPELTRRRASPEDGRRWGETRVLSGGRTTKDSIFYTRFA